MDLGATLCTRGRPDCANCPMRGGCVAERDGRQTELPAPKPAKALPERESIVTVFTDGERILLERRPETGIWGGLLALPEGTPEALAPGLGLLPGASEALPELKHTFTHFRLTLRPIRCTVKASHHTAEDSARGMLWLDREQLRTAALPAPIRKLLLALPQATR
jgi:A/G-specific adenine glycosylase